QRETVVKPEPVEIVEEQTADTARFVAVREKEVVVAPLLEFRVQVVAKRRTSLARHAMPGHHVFLEAIKRCQVKATAKPTYWRLAILFRDKETHVGVAGGHVRVVRVDHQRDAHGLKGSACQFRSMRGGGRRQARAMNVR